MIFTCPNAKSLHITQIFLGIEITRYSHFICSFILRRKSSITFIKTRQVWKKIYITFIKSVLKVRILFGLNK